MHAPKAYFLLPNTDIVPNTLIHLGQIVTALREPHRPLSPPLQPTPQTYTTQKENFTLSTQSHQKANVALLAQFLAQLGSPVSGNVSVEHEKGDATQWNINELQTTFIEPTNEYIERSIQRPEVQAALQGKLVGNAVYIITGLKIARGASYARATGRSCRVSSGISIDASALAGVPVSAGPEVGTQASKHESEACGLCSDVVWAVRMRKIHLSFWDKEMVLKDVFGGELCSYGDVAPRRDAIERTAGDDVASRKEVENADLEEDDLGVRYTPRGFRTTAAEDEFGEACAVFWQ
ncbi:hypothetical protein BDV95DRAFT_599866 [Massariosphaeria phaeospora]|uniref:Uncharacterized protein n=1 Tax=Massariosphaeria phaeospora TaxID=100035 RepID=A0A7C8MEM0_9PLEO|nr:hypothetical protein BDV95DRAFT_599866 [Massariosphaeria phaeospora]